MHCPSPKSTNSTRATRNSSPHQSSLLTLFLSRAMSLPSRSPRARCIAASSSKVRARKSPTPHFPLGRIFEEGADLTRVHYSRRQHERSAQGHHRHRARWAGEPSRPGLHPGFACAILHRAGHAQVSALFAPLPLNIQTRS